MRRLFALLIAMLAGLIVDAAPSMAHRGDKLVLVELTQGLIDQWIAFAKVVIPAAARADAAGKPADPAKPYADACSKAGFKDVKTCGDVEHYIVALMTGLDQAAGRVIDPVVSMTREMARITADTAMKPAEKDEELAEIKSTLEAFPASFPPAHIELINRNVLKILAVLTSGVK